MIITGKKRGPYVSLEDNVWVNKEGGGQGLKYTKERRGRWAARSYGNDITGGGGEEPHV